MDFYNKRDDLDLTSDSELHQSKGIASEIQEFFRGSGVLITGGSGFIGLIILEKILRSCPGTLKVFLLLRPKKGKSPNERLSEILQDVLFKKLTADQPEFSNKIVVVEGDCNKPNLGLREEDIEVLRKEVDIVFHAAAALNMDLHLRQAYTVNVQATKDLLQLAKDMKRLKAFIYISTAYSHTEIKFVQEEFYDPPYMDEHIKHLLDVLNDTQISALTPKLMGSSIQNTYALTKGIAEDVVKSFVGKLPVGIIRPSIVMGCAFEPLVAWINNIYGPTGTLLGAYIGLMRTWYCDGDKIADLIPVDFVANSAIASAWDVSCRNRERAIGFNPVYNIVSSSKSPTTWSEFMYHNERAGLTDRIQSKHTVGLYNFRLEKSIFRYHIQVILFHLIPGIFFDFAFIALRKNPRLLKTYMKIYKFNHKLGYYCHNEWIFTQGNLDKLWSKMNYKDRNLFYFDMTNFNWKAYYLHCLRGIRIYILKDPMTTLEESRRILGRWEIFQKLLTWTLKLAGLWLFLHILM